MRFHIQIDESRNDLLSDFSKAVLLDRYMQEGEDNIQKLFARVASYYGNGADHAQRLYDYMSLLWFMPATPILSNGGTERGLPISCYLNEVQDSMEGIASIFNENFWLSARGGGIGTYWGNLRSIGQKVKRAGKTSGVIPFMKMQDSQTLAVSQGSLRRGSSAVYMCVSHPEIEEFIEMRRPTGGDPNRKCLNIHHGISIPDTFMEAVRDDVPWILFDPKTKEAVSTIRARELWAKILTARIETGEPYLLFIDTVNKHIPDHHKMLGLWVRTSNLCSEITLPTGIDHLDQPRTAVCCLSSLNLEKFDEWKNDSIFINDIMIFLDNVLEDFINKAPEHMRNAIYSAKRERSVGLGVMGLHSFLQSKGVPFDSVLAKSWNKIIFEHIHKKTKEASVDLADMRGSCPDAEEAGFFERFSNTTAIAPTANISIIANNSSPGIEPFAANSFTQKTLTGSFNVRNKNLLELLEKKGQNNEKVWNSISRNEGSVQHLDFLNEFEKHVFRTALEIDQRWIIELAADRAHLIDQAQSVNLFLPANISKRELHQIHFAAWEKGVKSLYYCRSVSVQRAEKVSNNFEECIACQ